MTIHKSKGKQFDGVIVIREGRHNGQRQVSSFVWWDDEPPYWRSRKILRVGVTRARVHTLILEHVFPACPLMAGHNLWQARLNGCEQQLRRFLTLNLRQSETG